MLREKQKGEILEPRKSDCDFFLAKSDFGKSKNFNQSVSDPCLVNSLSVVESKK